MTPESFKETIRTILFAALIALGIRCFVAEPFSIPSGSMIPTLEVGDFLFVSKYSYGYSAKSSFFGIPLFDGRLPVPLLSHAPARGDVVVFKLPSDPSTDYIKRIIGLPGDAVQVRQGRLYINDKLVPREPINNVRIDKGLGRMIVATDYIETLPEGRTHIIREEGDDKMLDNTPRFEVPPESYFVMGDNRDNSQDSRVMRLVGFVPKENLVGPARFIFFSLTEGTRFLQFWRWPTDIRFSRLFTSIE